MKLLFIDVETFSIVNIADSGSSKYIADPSFEIILLGYSYGSEPVTIIDILSGEEPPSSFIADLTDPGVLKIAHNAFFEIQALSKFYNLELDVSQWFCTMAKSAYCGYPLGLGDVSEALNLEELGKKTTGKALIKFFCEPCKPSKANGERTRNYPEHDFDKWLLFIEYLEYDVIAEQEVFRAFAHIEFPELEAAIFRLDMKINLEGVSIDSDLARKAVALDNAFKETVKQEIIDITNVSNPSSGAQIKKWFLEAKNYEVKSLAKDWIPLLKEEFSDDPVALRVISLLQQLSKTSVSKYARMLDYVQKDGKGRGFFQYYGANKTGRWAGRGVQLQNLPRNKFDDIDVNRRFLKTGDVPFCLMMFGPDTAQVLSDLIRTAFIAPDGFTFAVADYSAIEARVLAWLANEEWRLEVFATHGKIYEASAANMFGIPIESVDSEIRQKGKIAELALGYQGSVGALRTMGGEKMGLSKKAMEDIVSKWRGANESITGLWSSVDIFAKKAIRNKGTVFTQKLAYCDLEYEYTGQDLRIKLPSGRYLFYPYARLRKKVIHGENGSFEVTAIVYMGVKEGRWTWIDTYGGSLVENIDQAIARDLLAYAMLMADEAGFRIPLHVHDEVAALVEIDKSQEELSKLEAIMGDGPLWAKGLPLTAKGYLTTYYKKD